MRIAVMPGDFAGKEVIAEGLKVLKVAAEKFSNQSNRNALAAIRKVARAFAKREVNGDELYEFVKHLNFLPQDLDREGTVEHLLPGVRLGLHRRLDRPARERDRWGE